MNIEKIAKNIVKSAGLYGAIPGDIRKYCEDEMKKHTNNMDYPADIWSHDGSSYDGYISFTDGDSHCDMVINGWDLYEIEACRDMADNMLKTCRESFIIDNKALYDGREVEGYGVLNELSNDDKIRLLDDENCPDDIKEVYDDYEMNWFSESYMYLTVEVQFRMERSYDVDSWRTNVYAYVADEYRHNKKYLYEGEFQFKEGDDPRPQLSEQIGKAFDAINK